jgi:glycosyltransferase involved in cell wall biosynthesis
VSRLFAPEHEGGTEVVVRAQARELAAAGHQVEIVCGTRAGSAAAGVEVVREVVDDLLVHRLTRNEEERGEPALDRPRLASLALDLLQGCDVVHVHHWDFLDRALVRTLSTRVPVIVTLHDDLVLRQAGTLRAELDAAVALLAPGPRRAARLERELGLAPGRIQIVPHGLCQPLERPAMGAPAPRAEGARLVVLHYGTLCGQKGTLDLMRSLSLLPHQAVELRLAGPGVDSELEAALGQAQFNVQRHGEYDPAALQELARGCHLAAFPTRLDESYGLVVDEALALGLPAWVSSACGSAERLEAWGRPGRILPAKSPLAWAEAFCSVLAAPHLIVEQRARIPEVTPTARDAVRMLEALYASFAGRSAA